MPGAWEIEKQRRERVLLSVISPPELKYSEAWVTMWAQLQTPPGSERHAVKGLPYHAARNHALKFCLDKGCGYLFFLDSVPGDTPLLVRDRETHEIDVLPIEDLVSFQGVDLERVPAPQWEVLISDSHQGGKYWSQIKHVVRHPYKGFMRNILTRAGFLCISPNHSVFLQNRGSGSNLVDASSIDEGDLMAMPRFKPYAYSRRSFFLGREDLAWLYGFFAAEGSVGRDQDGVYCSIKISNTDEKLIDFTQEVFQDYFNRPFCRGQEDNGRTKLLFYTQATDLMLGSFLRRMFYTKAGQKKVPRVILNAPTGIKLAFLRGYHAGDGGRRSPVEGTVDDNFAFHSFTTVSPTLAHGTMFLLSNCGLDYSLYSRPSNGTKQRTYQIDVLKDKQNRHTSDIARVISAMDIPFDGYVYDVSTEEERFVGGVGGFLLHNSDVIMPTDGLMTLINTGLDFVGGYYRKRYPPFSDAACMLVRNQEGKVIPGPLPAHKPGEIIAVDCLPTGCTLMSRRCLETVIAKYPRPYDWGADIAPVPDGQGGMIPPFSEDYLFSIRAKELGFQPWLATGVSCAHEFSAKITAQGVEAL